jgi:hypothetical protein
MGTSLQTREQEHFRHCRLQAVGAQRQSIGYSLAYEHLFVYDRRSDMTHLHGLFGLKRA